jgi:hypothetical protein
VKKSICIILLAVTLLFAMCLSCYAQSRIYKYQPVQYPTRLRALLPKTPQELRARMPKLTRKVYPPPKQALPPSVGKKVLIVLQENTGRLTYLPDSIPAHIKVMIETVIDTLAETFEDLKAGLQANGKYNKVVLLTDTNCTRSKLLENLVYYTKQGMTIDLLIMGHGGDNYLELHNHYHLTGQRIRDLLNDARNQGCQGINLRLVYMCNCWGSTTNDDWRAIGAKASVGPVGLNVMPEPQITFFLHNWLGGQKPWQAAINAYNGSVPFYSLVFPPTATVRYERVRKTYPCGTYWEPNCYVFGVKTGCFKIAWCTADFEVPVGVDLHPHRDIVSSKPLVNPQNSSWTFNTVYRPSIQRVPLQRKK